MLYLLRLWMLFTSVLVGAGLLTLFSLSLMAGFMEKSKITSKKTILATWILSVLIFTPLFLTAALFYK